MKKLWIVLTILCLTVSAHAQQWSKSEVAGTRTVSDIDYYITNNNTALDRLLANYNTLVLAYSSATQLTVSTGEVVVSNSTGTIRLALRNTTATTLTWADIDSGSAANTAATTYYVYAIAALATSETATFKLSTNSSTIADATYYKKIGSFYNATASVIDRTKVYANANSFQPTDSSGIKSIQAIYDYGSSTSAFTSKTGDLKFAYGNLSIGANSTATITNLPYSSGSTYSCFASFNQDVSNDDGFAGCNPVTGGTATIIQQQGAGTRGVEWMTIGY